MKRILFLSRGGETGGSQRQLLYVIENIDRSRYEPVVVCKDDGPFVDQLRRSCRQTHVLALRPWRKVLRGLPRYLDARRLTGLARLAGADLLYCSDLWMSGYLLHTASRLGLSSVLHVRAPKPADELRKHNCERADGLIAISNRIKRHLLQAGVDEDKVSVIYDAVNLAEFRPSRAGLNVLRRDFPHARGTLVGIVGQIKESKRQLEFLQMARRMVQTAGKDATFFVVGEPHAEGYCRMIQRYLAGSDLGSRVVLTGRRADIQDVLASLDVLVTLSGGSVMIEAMACGTPVVSAGFTPPEESTIVRHGHTGLLAEGAGLDAAIARLIDDPALRNQLGEAARRHAEANYGHLRLAEQTQRVFDRLLVPDAIGSCA